MRRVVLFLAVVGLVGCGGGSGPGAIGDGGSDAQMIQGSLLLTDDDLSGDGVTDCSGQGGYGDLGPGSDVTITNESGDIVGTGSLKLGDSLDDVAERLTADGFGDRSEVDSLLDSVEDFPVLCPMRFDVEVEDAKFYSVKIGNRDEQSESKSDLEEKDWRVLYTIGSPGDL